MSVTVTQTSGWQGAINPQPDLAPRLIAAGSKKSLGEKMFLWLMIFEYPIQKYQA